MSVKKTQIVLIITALILFVLLFIAPKIAPVTNTDSKENSINKSKTSFNNADLSIYLNLAEKSLDLEKKKKIEKLLSKSKFDSCVIFWDELKRPDIAAYYSEKIAEKENSAETWLKVVTAIIMRSNLLKINLKFLLCINLPQSVLKKV